MVKEKEKLIWLGLKRASQNKSEAETDIQKLRDNVGDYSTFQSDLNSVSSESDFNSYLQNNGFSSGEADNFILKINNNFTDSNSDGNSFDEFKSHVQNESQSYSELKSQFLFQSSFGTELETEDGRQAAGVRTFENSGVTYDGIQAPAGSLELFGQEIHFSQSGPEKTGKGSGSTGEGNTFTVSNFQTDSTDDTVTEGQTITFSADITNEGSYSEYYVASLIENGEAVENKNIRIGAGLTKHVEFERRQTEMVCNDYKINDSNEITACWIPRSVDY